MTFSPEEFKKESEDRFAANKKFIRKLKQRIPPGLDETFHTLHEEVFAETDCLQCANCCKTTSPIFRDHDIDRLSKYLRMKPSQFIEKYLHKDDDDDYVLNTSPCAFLNEDNYCYVYEARPAACREYPHTDRKRMYQILDLTLKNTKVCPAVLRIIEKMKKI